MGLEVSICLVKYQFEIKKRVMEFNAANILYYMHITSILFIRLVEFCLHGFVFIASVYQITFQMSNNQVVGLQSTALVRCWRVSSYFASVLLRDFNDRSNQHLPHNS
jgi:hypothetical protein